MRLKKILEGMEAIFPKTLLIFALEVLCLSDGFAVLRAVGGISTF
jgi:hypothetical protein